MAPANFDDLFSKRSGLIKPGLSRMVRAYEACDRPGASIPTILVGGTNGKGTTSGFLWQLLSQAGLKTGLYTSPHLRQFSERIQITDESIDDEALISDWQALQARLPAALYEPMSFFEVTTLMALIRFQSAAVDCNVLEVGLGGRWDATNITDPMASVIVSVGLDHQQYLGDSVAAITREKLGIMRPGRPLFLGSGGALADDAVALRLVYDQAEEIGSPVYRFGHEFGVVAESYYIRIPSLPSCEGVLPDLLWNAAPFVKANFVTALAVYHWTQCQSAGLGTLYRNDLSLRQGAAREPSSGVPAKRSFVGCSCGVGIRPMSSGGDRTTQFANSNHFGIAAAADLVSRYPKPGLVLPPCFVGRFQWVSAELAGAGGQQPLIIDVCHNIDGVQAFKASLEQTGIFGSKKQVPGLVSILKDKDINAMLDVLRGFLNPLMLFKIDSERSLAVEDLAPRHRDLALHGSFEQAWRVASDCWPTGSSPWVICGSVMAVGRTFEELSVYPDKLDTRTYLAGAFSP